MCGLRHHLKGLILLSVLIIISCQTTSQKNIQNLKLKKLSVDYYTIKTPEKNDVKYLDEYIKTNGVYSSDALILKAGYYTKTEDYTKAFDIFKKNPNIDTKNEILKKYLYGWRVKSYLENGEKPIVSDLNKIDLHEFCENINYRELINEECTVFENKKTEEIIEQNETDNASMNSEQTDNISDNQTYKIFIPANLFDKDITRGMLFSINENKVNVEIESAQYEENNKVEVDFNNYILTVDNVTYDFSFNYNDDFDEVISIIWGLNPTIVVIGVGKKNYIDVERIRSEIEYYGIKCIVVNYFDKNIQARIETINDEYGEDSITYIGIGTEDDMIKYIPIVKFASKHFENDDVIIMVDAFTNKFFKDEIKQYFYDVNVLTYIEAVRNYWSKEFENVYKGFYGNEPTGESFIGYDMILKLFNMNKVFVSNIDEFSGIKATRKLKYFKILRYNQVEVLDIPNYMN